MRKRELFVFTLTLVFVVTSFVGAQVPQVPRELKFADITVRINEQARREIQSDVDALYRSPTYFKVKAERANLYMPIVERELQSAGVPIDLKYLVIQESSLIPDAVSTSKAVGFWQFKQGTAEEVALRVDNQIDERKNIVSSTQGAARYLKKHNAAFDNWMCALVSYQMGLGGAKAYFGTQHNGKKVVEIDRNSHWYFKKFLAHKIAFESPQASFVSSTGYLEEARIQGPVTLKDLAPRLGVTEGHLKEYNKWTVKGSIPGDKPYSIVYLSQGLPQTKPTLAQQPPQPAPVYQTVSNTSKTAYPKVSGNLQKATLPEQIKVNNIDGVLAASTSTTNKFTEEIGLREKKFRKINDLDENAKVEAGKYYYTKPKKTKAEVEQHVVLPGETLWSISQMYGIKLSALIAKNRINNERDLKAGMILNLRENRKRNEEIKMVPAAEIQKIVNSKSNPSQPATNPVANPPVPNRSVEVTQPQKAPQQISHTVMQGENLFRISQKYGVSIDEIKQWNKLPDNNIRVGQKVLIIKP